MAMQSLLQVLSVNAVREGKTGERVWQSQDVEAATLDDAGVIVQVGRLRLPKDLIGQVGPGVYVGSFAFARNETKEGGGRLEARMTSLLPYAVKGQPSGVSASPGPAGKDSK